MAIAIRCADERDKDQWLSLYNQYIAFYEADIPADVIEVTWQRLIAQSDGMIGFSAVEPSGGIIGLAAVVFHRSTWSLSWYCYLEDLFVHPQRRGAGVGRALIEAVYAEADRRGATRTYWVTGAANATARRVYDEVAQLRHVVQYQR